MPIVVIPEKVCKKCGGTIWYIKTDKYKECLQCKRKLATNYVKNNLEKYRNEGRKHILSISDKYVKNLIQNKYRKIGIKISCSSISQREIEITRKMVEIKRQLNPKKMKSYTAEQIQQFRNEYEELGVLLKETPKEEKQAIHARRCFIKKKFSTIQEYENLIALGPEKEEIISPPEEQLVPVVIPALTMAEELSRKKKELEEKALQLGNEILEFNAYVETFKIIL